MVKAWRSWLWKNWGTELTVHYDTGGFDYLEAFPLMCYCGKFGRSIAMSPPAPRSNCRLKIMPLWRPFTTLVEPEILSFLSRSSVNLFWKFYWSSFTTLWIIVHTNEWTNELKKALSRRHIPNKRPQFSPIGQGLINLTNIVCIYCVAVAVTPAWVGVGCLVFASLIFLPPSTPSPITSWSPAFHLGLEFTALS